jgi:predicted AlkP superfamily phosphohydrolase/phosphomutase
MSDHGFGPLYHVVNVNLALLEHGLLKLKRGVWTQMKTGLFRAGITPASIWHLVERVGLQNYVWQVSKSTRNKVVSRFLSFDDVDWQRTRAYAIGHVGQIYVNLKGRQPEGIVEPGEEYNAVREEVTRVLETICNPRTGLPLVDRVIRGEEVTHGPYAEQGPDLHLVLDDYHAIAFPLFAADSHIVTKQIRGDSGCHDPMGVFIGYGPDFHRGTEIAGAQLIDLTPTILHLFGLAVPDDMDGKVLGGALTIDRPVVVKPATRPPIDAGRGLTGRDADEVAERLRALGYLG